jgi:hypothetical protein
MARSHVEVVSLHADSAPVDLELTTAAIAILRRRSYGARV